MQAELGGGREVMDSIPVFWEATGLAPHYKVPGGYPGSSADQESPAKQETLVQFLGWQDPLKKGKATHFSILGIPW